MKNKKTRIIILCIFILSIIFFIPRTKGVIVVDETLPKSFISKMIPENLVRINEIHKTIEKNTYETDFMLLDGPVTFSTVYSGFRHCGETKIKEIPLKTKLGDFKLKLDNIGGAQLGINEEQIGKRVGFYLGLIIDYEIVNVYSTKKDSNGELKLKRQYIKVTSKSPKYDIRLFDE